MKTARQISAELRAKAKGTVHYEIPKGTNTEGYVIRPTVKAKPFVKIKSTATEGFYVDERKQYKIVNANGYTVEQLSTELPEHDYDFIEQGIKIPLNYGMGVEVICEGKHHIFQRNGNWGKPTVTLEITTWRGISAGALHYYGKLKIRLPEMTEVGEKRTRSSNFFIPMYDNDTIELTQELEQWEIDKHPENYEYNHAGDIHRGFYTKKQVIDHAKKMFDEIFGEGWIFKVEER